MPSWRDGESMTAAPLCRMLVGRRVLVVEDEMLIALDTIDALTSAGATAIGPASRVTAGVTLARSEQIDAAVLDVYLAGTLVWPVADVLQERRIPFVFLTGFGGSMNFPDQLRLVPRLSKPLVADGLVRSIGALISPSTKSAGP